jgi:hypothetical protein
MSPGPFCPVGSAHATIPLSQFACRSFPCSHLRFRELLLRRPRQAPDLSTGTTEVLVSAQDFVPGPKISTLAEKVVVFSLPLLTSPGLPGWLPTRGPAG